MDPNIIKEEDNTFYSSGQDHPLIFSENSLDDKTDISNQVTLKVDPNTMCIKEELCSEEADFKIEYFDTEVKDELPVKSDDIEIEIQEKAERSPDCQTEKNQCETLNKNDKEVYYKCDKCDHRTTRKSGLKSHSLTHMDPSEVTLYKCNVCPYASKFKASLKVHTLTHKSITEACASNVPVKKSMRCLKTMCPICFAEVGHFPRHLSRSHSDDETVKKISRMSVNSNERRMALAKLRKKGNFILYEQNSKLKPVRKARIMNEEEYVPCTTCLGYYKRNYLSRHKRKCRSKNSTGNNRSGKKNQHLTEAQNFMVMTGLLGNYLEKTRLKRDVFVIMRPDKISLVAKTDALICLYGESYLNNYTGKRTNIVVSNKMRELARLKITLQKNTAISDLINALKPDMYSDIVAATKIISGYVAEKGTFKASSLALHLRSSLRFLCDVARKAIIKNNPLLGPFSTKAKHVMLKNISELKEMIESRWFNNIDSLANKIPIEKKCDEPKLLTLTEDIQMFNKHISNLADDAFNKLSNREDIETNYKLLTECTLCSVLLFNRKRIGEVQFLSIQTYRTDFSTLNQEWLSGLSELEKHMSVNLKIVVVFERGSNPVPILLTNRMQTYIDILLENRKDVKISDGNKYVFAYPGSQGGWISVVSIINKYAYKCGVTNRALLTNSSYGKQIATIMQLMTFETEEIEQIARFMGHGDTIPVEFYKLADDVNQAAKVAKILLLINAGKGGEYKGKSLSEIQVTKEETIIDEIEEHTKEQLREEQQIAQKETVFDKNDEMEEHTKEQTKVGQQIAQEETVFDEMEEHTKEQPKEGQQIAQEIIFDENDEMEEHTKDRPKVGQPEEQPIIPCNKNIVRPHRRSVGCTISEPSCSNENFNIKRDGGRVRWFADEKQKTLDYFKDHIKNKIVPKKGECVDFIRNHSSMLKESDWVRVKILVYNTYRNK